MRRAKHPLTSTQRILMFARVLLLAFTLGCALWLGTIASGNVGVQQLLASGGYLGVFLFSIINGFNVFVPIVTAPFVPALSYAGLNPYLVVLLMSLGMTIADGIAFYLAHISRASVSETNTLFSRAVVRAEDRRRSLPLFMLGLWSLFVPLPSELIVVPLGLLGYRAIEVIPIVAVGNLLFNILIGFGLVDLLALFGL